MKKSHEARSSHLRVRNLAAKALAERQNQAKIIPAKKGKGSPYKRRQKHKTHLASYFYGLFCGISIIH